jgi:3-deoxy-manno-octulosonate cytidylyltransferase (CMP-KDO synthetase)
MSGPVVIGVVPARFASSRFPGKALAMLAGKPLVQHVYESASKAGVLSQLIVATDDERIFQAVRSFGGQAQMTRSDHPSGTDRVAEVAQRLDADIVVNIQGDEPLIDPKSIEKAAQPLLQDPQLPMGTLKAKIEDPADIRNPNVVKVITDLRGRALYFSRSPIPFPRPEAQEPFPYYRHIGLYVYRRDFLLLFSRLPPTPLERHERLEQLRALEHGYEIAVVETDDFGIGVDTPEDLERVKQLLERAS